MQINVVHIFKELVVRHVHEFRPLIHEHRFTGPLTVLIKEVKPVMKEGGFIMYVVKDNNPDVGYAITPGQVLDAEGQVIEGVALDATIVSSDEAVVSLTPDPADPLKGTAHFGAPGLANINVTMALKDGTIVGSFGSQFTVTVGDPTQMAGGKVEFEGLAEV